MPSIIVGSRAAGYFSISIQYQKLQMKTLTTIITFTISVFVGYESMGISSDSTENIPDGVVIIDQNQPIDSFDELTEYFKGKAFFIDNWAPWCSPCIQEFEFAESLHKFLKEHNIEIVYLNSDSEIEMEKWIELINEHKLTGYHLRESRPLKYDMKDKGIDSQRLPQYLLVDKEGQVLEKNTLRPSASSELYNQIESLLNE